VCAGIVTDSRLAVTSQSIHHMQTFQLVVNSQTQTLSWQQLHKASTSTSTQLLDHYWLPIAT